VLPADATTFDMCGSVGGRCGGSGCPSDGSGFWPFIDIQTAAIMQHGRLAEDTWEREEENEWMRCE
jgi:hypothetical protein